MVAALAIVEKITLLNCSGQRRRPRLQKDFPATIFQLSGVSNSTQNNLEILERTR